MRTAGRALNGMVDSECAAKGGLTCSTLATKCTGKESNDQLKAGFRGNLACAGCHPEHSENPSAHSHHRADSAGNECQNCHMPHTTYGLRCHARSPDRQPQTRLHGVEVVRMPAISVLRTALLVGPNHGSTNGIRATNPSDESTLTRNTGDGVCGSAVVVGRGSRTARDQLGICNGHPPGPHLTPIAG